MSRSESIYTAITGKIIGLSISESEDLAKLGFGYAHLEDAKIEIARHLLSCGATLMYGGDLRDNGHTRKLFELVENYKIANMPEDHKMLINVLGWPLQQTLTTELRASLSDRISFAETGLPSDLEKERLSAKQHLSKDLTNGQRYHWARTMTYMREYMTKENDARVILGGKTSGYKGKYPGIVEEAYLSIEAGKPTFIVGAFGGAAADVIQALNSRTPQRLSAEYQFQNVLAEGTAQYYNEHKPKSCPPIEYQTLIKFFESKGVNSLNNGLSEEENKRLVETMHIPEMVALILKGLVSIYG
ncbi:hypothetical protein [Owenweeksia hongkongensis]|uniref:hypothetical protein n=1 Tax=Owenweeksia hongkongensis TaxID=253245 RepID=UPI003A8DD694